MKTIPINFTVNDKTVMINSFSNLTDNEELNLFEDGIANMLEESLTRIPGTKVIPRRSFNKFLAVGDMGESISIRDIARQKGANYVLDGWISKFKDDYRVYSNLLNVETGQVEEKFVVAKFANKEEAMLALNDFVSEISAKLGNSKAELEKGLSYKYLDYDLFSLRLKAVSSYYRGRPDVAISLLEQASHMLETKYKDATGQAAMEKFRANGHIHFLLAQIQAELHNYQKARQSVAVIKPFINQFKPVNQRCILALEHETRGEFAEARDIYTELANDYPHEQYYFIRLADTILLSGGSRSEALAVLERGVNLNPEETRLHRTIAKLQLQGNGEQEVENLALERMEKERIAAGNEMVSTLATYKMKEQLARTMPVQIIRTKDNQQGSEKDIELLRFGNLEIDLEKLQNNLDYGCPDTTMHAYKMASMAVFAGENEVAEKIAQFIKERGTAANSENTYKSITSMILAGKGEIAEAKKFAKSIEGDSYIKALTWGNLLMHMGNYEKAAYLLEKALKMEEQKDPVVLLQIANAYLLAGNYNKWDAYNTQFIEVTSEMNLVSPHLKVKLKPRWEAKSKPVTES